MHIAFWSPAWPLEGNHNGIITYVHAMKQGLQKRGHRVTVFTGRLDREEDGVILVRPSRWTAMPFGFSSRIASAILREHRRNPIDVIEMEESFGWCAGVQKRTGIPMVVKLHGPAFLTFTESEQIRERIECEGRALSRCHTIVSPSQANLDRTLKRYKLAGKDMQVIPNPIAIDEEAPVWSLDKCDRKTVLFVGRFDHTKGADVVLQAMRGVWTTHPEARLFFVGPEGMLPSPRSGVRLGFWNYCCALFSPEEREAISYLGPRSRNEIEQFRASAMVTVVASRWESQCYTLMESMAQGCPVVSTNAGGCQEIVRHGETGLLARSEDPEDFAKQLCAILSEPHAAAVMGHAAREHVLSRYSIDETVNAAIKCHERAILKNRPLARTAA